MEPWAVVADVATWAKVTADANLSTATDVANDWAYHVRPDLRAAQAAAEAEVPPAAWEPPPAVKHAVILYAALLWREQTSPQGYATYTEFGQDVTSDVGSAITNIYRLIGSRKPVIG